MRSPAALVARARGTGKHIRAAEGQEILTRARGILAAERETARASRAVAPAGLDPARNRTLAEAELRALAAAAGIEVKL
ncbi:MAG: hypothetical protein ACYCS1_07920 [Gammaproteobacteria bacterium]